jgi:hypothetical protein
MKNLVGPRRQGQEFTIFLACPPGFLNRRNIVTNEVPAKALINTLIKQDFHCQ